MLAHQRRCSRSQWRLWALWVVLGLLAAWSIGRLQPHFVPDSPSYLDYPFDSAAALARSIRPPGYPLWLLAIRSVAGLSLVPAAQVVLHATAAFWLYRQLAQWQMPRGQALAVGIAVAIGCTPTDHIHTIAADAPAASVAVLLVAALLCWTRRVWSDVTAIEFGDPTAPARRPAVWRGAALVVLLATMAIAMRPAYLFLVPWLVLIVCLLGRIRGAGYAAAAGAGLTVALPVLVLLLGWMGFRFWAAGDFGLLPFGHQNLAGVLVQLVSDDELAALDGDARSLAHAVVEQKRAYLAAGGVFAAGAPGATMTIDARWDDMTYAVVVPASRRVAGADPVDQHAAVRDLNRAIIHRYPLRYLVWIAKAARRGAWGIAADIVMHPVFLVAIMLAAIAAVARALRDRPNDWSLSRSRGLRALTVITISYTAAKLGFVILSSPPIGRFSDAAAIFLPGWLAALCLHLWFAAPQPSPQPLASR